MSDEDKSINTLFEIHTLSVMSSSMSMHSVRSRRSSLPAHIVRWRGRLEKGRSFD